MFEEQTHQALQRLDSLTIGMAFPPSANEMVYAEGYKSYSQDPKQLGNSVSANTWLHGIPNQNAWDHGSGSRNKL
jgi:hypothetical protein